MYFSFSRWLNYNKSGVVKWYLHIIVRSAAKFHLRSIVFIHITEYIIQATLIKMMRYRHERKNFWEFRGDLFFFKWFLLTHSSNTTLWLSVIRSSPSTKMLQNYLIQIIFPLFCLIKLTTVITLQVMKRLESCSYEIRASDGCPTFNKCRHRLYSIKGNEFVHSRNGWIALWVPDLLQHATDGCRQWSRIIQISLLTVHVLFHVVLYINLKNFIRAV